MTNNVVLSAALRSTIESIKRTQLALDRTSLRLATGKEVNSALDNPQNFFAARALGSRAADFSRLLDGIGQSIRVIQEAMTGVKALERLLTQAQAIATDVRDKIAAGEEVAANEALGVDVSPTPLSQQILAAAPVAYWRLNEAAGATAVNIGSGGGINGTYTNGVVLNNAPLYDNQGDNSARFDGINDFVAIPDSPLINTAVHAQRTVEVVFRPVTTAGRQVIYEEGGATNSFTIYIDNGELYLIGRDQGAWGPPLNIHAPVVAGETYHAAFVFDRPTNSFTGYLNGVALGSTTVANQNFPSHTADVAIGAMRNDAWYHDGSQNGNGNYFNGFISDIALYNAALSSAEIQNHADSLISLTGIRIVNRDFEALLENINFITHDAQYRGINLLAGDDLYTQFNITGSSFLLTKGVNFSADALGIPHEDFDDLNDIDSILAKIRTALARVREYGFTLANDFSVVTIRREFTENHINNHLAGESDITIADQNEEGANLIASQVRQAVAQEALSFASRAQATILDIITGNA